MIDQKLLQILACPSCKAAVSAQGEWLVCTNPGCNLRFPVRDGIPIMLIEEAEKLSG